MSNISVWAVMAVASGILLLALAGCAGGQTPESITPAEVSPEQLWRSTEAYEGKVVRTSGVLRVFSAGTPDEHYAVEAEGQYRVGVKGVAADVLQALVNKPVQVEGVFRFREDFGIFIEVARFEPTASSGER